MSCISNPNNQLPTNVSDPFVGFFLHVTMCVTTLICEVIRLRKPFWIPLILSLVTIIGLYGFGFIYDYYIAEFSETSFRISFGLLPVIIGVLVGFVSEWIIRLKSRVNSD